MGLTPLEYLLKALANPQTSQRRRDRLAEVCLPYIHPRLNATASVNVPGANYTPPELRIYAVPHGCQIDKNGVIHHPDGTPASDAEIEFTPFKATPDLLPLPSPEPAPAESLPVHEVIDDGKIVVLRPYSDDDSAGVV
jgi:hypothetical protein